MKKILFFSLMLCFSLSAYSQSNGIPGKWGITKWGVSMGQDQDMLGSVEHDYLLSTIRGTTNINYSKLNFRDEEVSSMTCENPHLRITATLPVPGRKNMELNVAAILVANKIDAVHYYYPGVNGDHKDAQSLSFDAMTNEIGVEASLIKKGSIGNVVNFYGGAGTNMGTSVGGTLHIAGENIQINQDQEILNFARTKNDTPPTNTTIERWYSESRQIKNGWYQRGFLQAGIGLVILKRLELGMEYRHGLGYRAIPGADTKGTQYRSGAVTAKWILK